MNSYTDVIRFWFEELTPKDWWVKSESLDKKIQSLFGGLLASAAAGECAEWRETADGRLAEIIVLDQFSRNIFRDTTAAFAQDPMALTLSQHAIALGDHRELPSSQAAFTAMPYMHSESRSIHRQAVTVFTEIGNSDNLNFELKHKQIIDRFGRYPHRNAILRRTSTPEEDDFLSQPGSSF
jgi:uncharacterized protein (DUF924 family)